MDQAAPEQKPAGKDGTAAPSSRTRDAHSISPFDEPTTETVIAAIREFRAGLSQALLYTTGTVQFEKACEATFACLNAALGAAGAWKLGIVHGHALVNGARMETPTGLRGQLEYIEKMLTSAGTGSVKFEPGLTLAELGPFLQLIARRQLPRVEGQRVNQFLREQGIMHLQVDDLRYVELKGAEHVVSGEGHVFSDNAVAHKAVSELVDATLETINKVEDERARVQLRADIADQLIEKNEAMLPNLLATATERLKEKASDEHVALAALPPRDGQLLSLALETAAALPPDAAPPREALRRLIAQLVKPYEAQAEELLAQVRLTAADYGVLPEWLVLAHASCKEGSAPERLAGILRQSPGALLDEKMFQQIVDVLDELSVAGMEDEAERLTAHLAWALRTPTKHERQKAVERLSFLLKRSIEQFGRSVQILEDAMLEACSHETSDEVMKLLLAHLANRCTHHYQIGNWQRSLQHVEWIANLEASRRLALRDEGSNLAAQTREALAESAFAQALPDDLSAEGEKGSTAAKMIQALGAAVWDKVVQRLRAEPDPAVARRLAARLKEIGGKAVQFFFTELGREADGPTALRMLDLAPLLDDSAGLIAQVPALVQHADQDVRRRAIELAIAQDGGAAAEMLLASLHGEGNAERRYEWISALARLQDPVAEENLVGELNRCIAAPLLDERCVTGLLETLCAKGNRAVIAAAETLLRPRGTTLMLGSGGAHVAPRAVVVAAIKALAPFYKDPQAVVLLERMRKDKDSEIARLALVCLRGIVAAEQSAAQEKPAAHETAGPPAEKPAPRKGKHAFEELEAAAQVETAFQPGAGVAASVTPDARRPAEGGKPSLEGVLGDFGLAMALRVAGGRDGVLRVQGPAGHGCVYVRARRIIGATYAGQDGLDALAAIEMLKNARFGYFPLALSIPPTLDLDIEGLPNALREFRAARE